MLAYKIQYSLLDSPEITRCVFYPRKDSMETPPGATDHLVSVEENLSVSCRFYRVEGASASFLFFHGNGEVASDYDSSAPIYNSEGINLFALELAAKYPEDIRGLILESGSANPGRLLRRFSIPVLPHELEELERASLDRVKFIILPVLVIHGEYDTLIPVSHAIDFYENVGSRDKELVIIPGAGHNDIMLIGMKQYISAIGEFVLRHAGRGV